VGPIPAQQGSISNTHTPIRILVRIIASSMVTFCQLSWISSFAAASRNSGAAAYCWAGAACGGGAAAGAGAGAGAEAEEQMIAPDPAYDLKT
jgi:hypothetical protein